MAFKVGDIITGRSNNGCGVTNKNALMLVTELNYYGDDMRVTVLFHNFDYIGRTYWVKNSDSQHLKSLKMTTSVYIKCLKKNCKKFLHNMAFQANQNLK